MSMVSCSAIAVPRPHLFLDLVCRDRERVLLLSSVVGMPEAICAPPAWGVSWIERRAMAPTSMARLPLATGGLDSFTAPFSRMMLRGHCQDRFRTDSQSG